MKSPTEARWKDPVRPDEATRRGRMQRPGKARCRAAVRPDETPHLSPDEATRRGRMKRHGAAGLGWAGPESGANLHGSARAETAPNTGCQSML